ncbi:MAG: condensation domain-containing protein, partial [Vicinamibacteria bacterium]
AQGLRLRAREVFEHPTIFDLARTLGSEAERPRESDAPEAIEGPVPLLPIQQWFFEQDVFDRHHFNQAMMAEPSEPLDREALTRAWQAVFDHHEGLGTRAIEEDGRWRLERVQPRGRVDVEWIELPDSGEEEIVSSRARDLQRGFDLSRYPLGRLAYFDRGREKPGVLFVVFHHLVMDAVSIRIVLEDLTTAYRQAVSGEPIRLPEKTSSVARWARHLVENARDAEVAAELSYWTALPWSDVAPLPRDSREGANLISSAETLELSLDEVSTEALLQGLPRSHGASAHEALLAALALSLSEWMGTSAACIDVEGHGRESEDLDLSRTVGWFTSLYPAALAVERGGETLETLKRVRDQLRAIPRSGLGYGLLRYLSEDENVRRSMRELPDSEV